MKSGLLVRESKGTQFCYLSNTRTALNAIYRTHTYDLLCNQHDIEHRITKPNVQWASGQVERMNRTLKRAIVKRYRY